MARDDEARAAIRDQLNQNHEEARAFLQNAGRQRLLKVLTRAQRDLEKRLEGMPTSDREMFTHAQARATLAQIRHVTKQVQGGIQSTLLAGGRTASERAAGNTVRYLNDIERVFQGTGTHALAVKEARIVDTVATGVDSTILRRLGSTEPNQRGAGILRRYGLLTVGHFEDVLQTGILTKKSWGDMRDEITEASPFLKAAPRYWAERIVRTEQAGIYNRAAWETVREADDELGDMVKIISSIFDNRTSADSYAVHGEIRRPSEAFESWFGLYQHPPDRPNDRSTVVPHRISWPIPSELKWKSDAEVRARWVWEGRKGSPPKRPKMTTVPLAKFGKTAPPKKRDDRERVARDRER